MAISFFGKGFYSDDMYAGTQDPKTATKTTIPMVNHEVVEPLDKLQRSIEKMDSIRPSDDLKAGVKILLTASANIQNVMQADLTKKATTQVEPADELDSSDTPSFRP